ncbi:MAG: GtrA family protein, partial [Paludibacter sp.]
MRNKSILIQLLKFGIVGVANTLLTALTIWLLLKVLHYTDYLSNIIGYCIGLINSFIWNRKWTFRSSKSKLKSMIPFLIVFIISYIGNLSSVIISVDYLMIDPNIAQIFGIIVYSVLNFIL